MPYSGRMYRRLAAETPHRGHAGGTIRPNVFGMHKLQSGQIIPMGRVISVQITKCQTERPLTPTLREAIGRAPSLIEF